MPIGSPVSSHQPYSPSSGTVELAGQQIYAMPRSSREAWCASRVGVVPHQANLLAPLTVRENLALVQGFALGAARAAQKAGLPAKPRLPGTEQIMPLLEQLDVAALADRSTQALSQGQQQRVAIARALIHSPDLILADEPTAHLDDETCERTLDALQNAARQQSSALIVVTHDQRVRERFARQITLGVVQ